MEPDIEIAREYSHECGNYSDFTQRIETLVSEILREREIPFHSITSRVKSSESVEAKVQESDGRYTSIADITDLAGVRVITHFATEVGRVAEVIKEELDVDIESCTDDYGLLDPERFGCMSVNCVVRLPRKRLELSEYKRFSGYRAEIQIRSMLQHAWAEIERDLGYRSSQAIPKDLRRTFARLAGLLETADIQFADVRESLQEYEARMHTQIDSAPSSVLIDQASLKYLVENNKLVRELDSRIVSSMGAEAALHEGFLGRLVDKLNYFGLTTIADVDSSLSDVGDTTVAFAKAFMPKKHQRLWSGVSLFYMCYVLSAQRGSVDAVRDYIHNTFADTSAEREATAEAVVATYGKIAPKPGAKQASE